MDYESNITCIQKHTKHPFLFFSGGFHGQVKTWLLNRKKSVNVLTAHIRPVSGLAVDFRGLLLLSFSEDLFLKAWNIFEINNKPEKCFRIMSSLSSLAAHPSSHFFITGSKGMMLWDLDNFKLIRNFKLESGLVTKIKFHFYENNVLCCCKSDGSVFLLDLRLSSAVTNFFFKMPANDVCWDNIFPWKFTVASEDGNLYSFDIKKIQKASKIFKRSTQPVTSIDHSTVLPEIISSSRDGVVKLFSNGIHSYVKTFSTQNANAKISCVLFSLHGEYIIGADKNTGLYIWENFKDKKYFYLGYDTMNFKISFDSFPLVGCFDFSEKKLKKKVYVNRRKDTCLNINNIQRLAKKMLPKYVFFKEKI